MPRKSSDIIHWSHMFEYKQRKPGSLAVSVTRVLSQQGFSRTIFREKPLSFKHLKPEITPVKGVISRSYGLQKLITLQKYRCKNSQLLLTQINSIISIT
jgi:hypothetical protein